MKSSSSSATVLLDVFMKSTSLAEDVGGFLKMRYPHVKDALRSSWKTIHDTSVSHCTQRCVWILHSEAEQTDPGVTWPWHMFLLVHQIKWHFLVSGYHLCLFITYNCDSLKETAQGFLKSDLIFTAILSSGVILYPRKCYDDTPNSCTNSCVWRLPRTLSH